MQFFCAVKNLKYILWKSTKLGLVGTQLTINSSYTFFTFQSTNGC